MIDLYTFYTPNGRKVSIMLEECQLPYNTKIIDISEGEQFTEKFIAISPNNKIPAIVDHDGPGGKSLALAESAAILMYLAEKAGRFYPVDKCQRAITNQWLFFQMGHIGPMLGQAHHFRNHISFKIDYAINRYTNEAHRLYKVLDDRLATTKYLAGDDYTIADIATFPWIVSHDKQGVDINDYPHVRRWFGSIATRGAVKRGLSIP